MKLQQQLRLLSRNADSPNPVLAAPSLEACNALALESLERLDSLPSFHSSDNPSSSDPAEALESSMQAFWSDEVVNNNPLMIQGHPSHPSRGQFHESLLPPSNSFSEWHDNPSNPPSNPPHHGFGAQSLHDSLIPPMSRSIGMSGMNMFGGAGRGPGRGRGRGRGPGGRGRGRGSEGLFSPHVPPPPAVDSEQSQIQGPKKSGGGETESVTDPNNPNNPNNPDNDPVDMKEEEKKKKEEVLYKYKLEYDLPELNILTKPNFIWANYILSSLLNNTEYVKSYLLSTAETIYQPLVKCLNSANALLKDRVFRALTIILDQLRLKKLRTKRNHLGVQKVAVVI